jgi:prophage regulatory protein
MPADTGSRILRLKTVLNRTGLSRSTLYRKIERGTFPKQVRISERCVGWRESDLERWLRDPVDYPDRIRDVTSYGQAGTTEPSS